MFCKTRMILTTLAAAMFIFSATSAFAQESATPEASTPIPAGSIYKASEIENMRALAAQVNWKEGTVDEAVSENADQYDMAWIQSVKAAVFGDAERLQRALQAIEQLLQTNSVDKPQVKQIARLIESFDLLQATTEWKALPQIDREAFTVKLEAYLKEIFQQANFISFNSSFVPSEHRNMASWKALQAYWGALTKNAEWIQQGCRPAMGVSWLERLQNDMTSEGFFGNSPGEHVTTASIGLAAGTALRSASPDAYIEVKPYLQAMLNAATELTQPNGEWPVFLNNEQPTSDQNAELFERGYRLFGDQRSALLLDRIYQSSPRSVLHAVIGGSTLLKAMDAELSSMLMPQTGAVWLRSEGSPISVLMDTGVSRYGKHSGLLSLSVYQNQTPWAEPAELSDGIRFNDVVVDGQEQKPLPVDDFGSPEDNVSAQNALVMNMRETDEGAYVSATATGQFTERPAYTNDQVAGIQNSAYQRSLYLTDNLLIDLFWVGGGSSQTYRYHTGGQWQAQEGSASFVSTQANSTERLWSVNPEGLQFKAGAENLPGALEASYEGQGNLFAFIHEFVDGELQPMTVQLLTLDPAPNARNFQAIGFAVERGSRTDLFFASLSREIEYSGKYKDMPFTFQGDVGHMQFESATLESLFLTGGSMLEYDQYGVALNQPMQYGGVNAVSAEETMARTIMPESVPIYGLYSILALDMNSPSVMYQPFWVKAAGYSVNPNQPQQHLMMQPSLTENKTKGLGLKLREGCKTVFHHTVTMKRYEQENRIKHEYFGGSTAPGYRVVTTAPVRVRIPVWNNMKKVFFAESSIIDRHHGNELNGVIEVAVLPTESNQGRISFAYSP